MYVWGIAEKLPVPILKPSAETQNTLNQSDQSYQLYYVCIGIPILTKNRLSINCLCTVLGPENSKV